jgi:hypothetical protein
MNPALPLGSLNSFLQPRIAMLKFWGKLPDPFVRIAILFIVVVGGFLAARTFLPSSFTNQPQHVLATIKRETERPVKYAGSIPCADCHEEATLKRTGYHRNLACETCHGAAKSHAEDPASSKPVAPRQRDFCVLCHQYDASRPTGFPQINPVAHNPMKPCVSCHNPHDPKPPSTPQECQACHAQIARTKAISPHALLECTTCHTVQPDHKVSPRTSQASVPDRREFCGKCHGKASKEVGMPKVDLAAHWEKYLCWQCHYPHMPEVK